MCIPKGARVRAEVGGDANEIVVRHRVRAPERVENVKLRWTTRVDGAAPEERSSNLAHGQLRDVHAGLSSEGGQR